MDQFDILRLPEPLKSNLRPRVRSLYTRLRYTRGDFSSVAWWVRVMAAVVIEIAVVVHGSPAEGNVARLGLAYIAMLAFTWSVLHPKAWIRPLRSVLPIVVIGYSGVLAFQAAKHAERNPGAIGSKVAEADLLGLILYLLLQVAIIVMLGGSVRYSSPESVELKLRPGDLLAQKTLAVMSEISTKRSRWYLASVSVEICSSIRALANYAQYQLATGRRGAVGALAREGRDEATRISELYASHQRRIILAASRSDFDAVVASMGSAALALLIGDRDALLANAPTAVSRITRLRGWGRRSLPAFVLLATGAVLPLLPLTAAQHAVAEQVSWGLIAVGVTMLVTSNTDVANRVSGAVARSLGGK